MNIIIFTGGNPPNHTDFLNFYSRIVQEGDIIIAADSGIDVLHDLLDSMKNHTNNQLENSTIQDGMLNSLLINTLLKPAYFIGDMDSVLNKDFLRLNPDAKIIEFDQYKDWTDTELSLKKAKELDPYANIVLVGGNGGRPDHFISIFETFSSEFHPSVWLCGPQAIYHLADGQILNAENLNHNDIVSIARLSTGSSCGMVRTTGLEWGDECMRKCGMPSISNKIKIKGTETVVTVKAEGGTFLVFLPYTADVTIQQKDK